MGYNPNGVNRDLVTLLERAIAQYDQPVKFKSGLRPGDPRLHGRGLAIDVTIMDPKTGQAIPDYQNAQAFPVYERFANHVRGIQQQQLPHLNEALRWGGYFSGGPGKYGALDLMHFDLGGKLGLPMGGGAWGKGLTPEQARIWGIPLNGTPPTQVAQAGPLPAPVAAPAAAGAPTAAAGNTAGAPTLAGMFAGPAETGMSGLGQLLANQQQLANRMQEQQAEREQAEQARRAALFGDLAGVFG